MVTCIFNNAYKHENIMAYKNMIINVKKMQIILIQNDVMKKVDVGNILLYNDII